MTVSRSIPLGALCVLALLQSVGAQNRPAAKPLPPGDWPMYRHDTPAPATRRSRKSTRRTCHG